MLHKAVIDTADALAVDANRGKGVKHIKAKEYLIARKLRLVDKKIAPKTVKNENGVIIESLIGYEDTPCFAENRITLCGGSYTPSFGPSVWIVLEGSGTIGGENYSRSVKKGDYFFLPFAALNRFTLHGDGLVLAECLPSKDNL